MNSPNGNLLEVKDLRTYFETEDGTVKAVDGISFELKRGETLGIVGESGSGKSVANLSIIRLVPEPQGKIISGQILFNGEDILSLPREELREDSRPPDRDDLSGSDDFAESVHADLKAVDGDDPASSRSHNRPTRHDHRQDVELVGIPDARERVDSYPHEFSGGMRQRVMIAMALSCQPELLIADEPTTALDVTIQAQILELIRTLKSETGTSVILITHDLGVVAGMTDHVIVMYAGKVFEQAPTAELFACPGNPYTKGLLRSVPDPTVEQEQLYQIPGLPPDLANLPAGCPFAPRCDRVEEICRREFPPFVELKPGHHSLCHFARDVYDRSCEEQEQGTRSKRLQL